MQVNFSIWILFLKLIKVFEVLEEQLYRKNVADKSQMDNSCVVINDSFMGGANVITIL